MAVHSYARSSSGGNFRKSKLKKIGAWLLGILVVILACGGVFALFGGNLSFEAFEKTRNKHNLIEIGADTNYIETMNTNRGVQVTVKEDGTIKLSGKATSSGNVKVTTLTLDSGTYTLSGLESEIDEFQLYAQYGVGDLAIAGTDTATFTLSSRQTVDILISWSEDHVFNVFTGNTVRPVLVAGDKAGEFYD